MADRTDASERLRMPPLSVPVKAYAAPEPAPEKAAPPAAPGVRIKAHPGMKDLSVGGLRLQVGDDGFFMVPEALAADAVRHLKGIEHAADLALARAEAKAEGLAAEAAMPAWAKALAKRLEKLGV